FGFPRRVTRLERQPSPYQSSFSLEELRVQLDDGSGLEVIFKDLGPQGLTRAARGTKPAFLYDPLREIRVYEEVLAPAQLGTATVYGTVVDPAASRFWIFLEGVRGTELYQVGE